jgi:hypothetical protein
MASGSDLVPSAARASRYSSGISNAGLGAVVPESDDLQESGNSSVFAYEQGGAEPRATPSRRKFGIDYARCRGQSAASGSFPIAS